MVLLGEYTIQGREPALFFNKMLKGRICFYALGFIFNKD